MWELWAHQSFKTQRFKLWGSGLFWIGLDFAEDVLMQQTRRRRRRAACSWNCLVPGTVGLRMEHLGMSKIWKDRTCCWSVGSRLCMASTEPNSGHYQYRRWRRIAGEECPETATWDILPCRLRLRFQTFVLGCSRRREQQGWWWWCCCCGCCCAFWWRSKPRESNSFLQPLQTWSESSSQFRR